MMRASGQGGAATPDLAKIRSEAAAAKDRCRARYQWSDAAASHAQMAFIAKLGMALTRPPVSEAGFDPDRVVMATRALSAAQHDALRQQDQEALKAFMVALNAVGVFPKNYQQGVIIGAFAGYIIAYDESARLFALD
jgi:hypothetical protein